MADRQTIEEKIIQFLAAEAFAVAGASSNRDKYGNKVLRCYQQNSRRVIPVNPRAETIEGLPCVASVADLPAEVTSLSIITPPTITEQIVEQAIACGIKNIWMQPGAENPHAVARCEEAGINLIADGSCLLVVLGYHEA
jgi:predicted CoA-binding protein